MPLRPKLTYSSPMLQFYYEINEMRPYLTQRVPKWFLTGTARKLATWWEFYCGFILSVPLVLPGLLRKGTIRWLQAAVLVGLITLSFFSSPTTDLEGSECRKFKTARAEVMMMSIISGHGVS